LKPKHILKLLKRLIKMVRFEPDDREQAIIKEILLLRLLALIEGYDFKLTKLKKQYAYRVKLIKPKKHKAKR